MIKITPINSILFSLLIILKLSTLVQYCETNVTNVKSSMNAENFRNQAHISEGVLFSNDVQTINNFKRNKRSFCQQTKATGTNHTTNENFKDIFENFWDYSKIENYLQYINDVYPDVAKLNSIGKTYYNRTMYTVTIGSGLEYNNKIFISAGLHAREWSSIIMALYLIYTLVECRQDPTSTMYYMDWIILPVANPDGYEYSFHQKEQRWWRKNRKPCLKKCSKHQECGADLNLNFGDGFGGSSNPCSNVYTGSEPFSEEETINMAQVLGEKNATIKLYLGIHSYGGLLLYPYTNFGKGPCTNENELIRVAKLYTNAANEGHTKESEKYHYGNYGELIYPSAGSVIDFVKATLKIPYVYVLRLIEGEHRNKGFYIKPEDVLPIAEQCFQGIKAMVEDIYLNYLPAKSFLREKLGYRRRRRNQSSSTQICYYLVALITLVLYYTTNIHFVP